jgi:hypothetical protein
MNFLSAGSRLVIATYDERRLLKPRNTSRGGQVTKGNWPPRKDDSYSHAKPMLPDGSCEREFGLTHNALI